MLEEVLDALNINPDLLPEQRQAVSDPLGCNLPPVEIKLRDPTPHKEQRRPKSLASQKLIDECVQEMLKAGVIEETTTTEFVHETVLVKKKNTDKRRFCVDYRPMNEKLIYDFYPQADSEENIRRFAGKKFYAHFDLKSGYWQLVLAVASRAYTAFYANGRIYNFTVVPFGIANAPSWFQKVMNDLLFDLDFAQAFQDDISVGSDSFEDLMRDLDILFQRLEKYNFKLQAKKCSIGYEWMELPGHIVSGEGICSDPGKVEAVLNAPPPTNKKELASFHGFVQWYQRYIPAYAIIAALLLKMLRKQASWV